LHEVAALPMNVLARRYGIVGKHLWLACQGRDTGAVVQDIAPPKSVGHGKVLPPHTISARTIQTYLRHMCEKVATRLRRLDMQAGKLYVGLRSAAPGAVIEAVLAEQKPIHERARMYQEDPTLIRNIIADGCERADKLAQETMRDVRAAMGLNYS